MKQKEKKRNNAMENFSATKWGKTKYGLREMRIFAKYTDKAPI